MLCGNTRNYVESNLMLNITYAVNDSDLAERMQRDLAQANMRSENPMLIVLVSPESNADNTVRETIQQALANKEVVLPIIVREAPLPDALKNHRALNLSQKYKSQRLIQFVRRANLTQAQVRNNRLILLVLGVVVLVMFGISLASIGAGVIAFPEEEYATENALRNQQIETLVYPTIDAFLPRSTEDALAFPATIEAANTRNAPLLSLTATGIHEQRQATDSAIATAADLTATARAVATESAGD